MLSLFVALTLIVTCLSGMVFAADPIAKVETGGKVVEVANVTELLDAVNPNGTSVVTLLKDIEHPEQIKLPVCTFDLNGHTWSTVEAEANALYFDGRSLTAADASNLTTVVKNGTINAGRTAISVNVGALTVQNATLIAHAEIPAIQLLNGKTNTLAEGKWNSGNLMENCTVYCATGPIFRFNTDNVDFSAVKYTIKDSTLVTESETNPLLMSRDGATSPGTFELGKGVSFYYKASTAVVQSGEKAPVMTGEKIETAEGTKSVTVAGKTYEGMTMSYTDGAAPVAPAPAVPSTPATPSVPSTGTPDVSVPTTGVSVVALGVMALVSLAGAVITKKH